MTETIQDREDTNMHAGSTIIKQYTREYTKYIVSHHFPNPIDSFKSVHRRILWAIRNNVDDKIKAVSLLGKTTVFHPFGDSAIYDAAVRLAQLFKVSYPLLEVVGNAGSYPGDTPADFRYVDFKVSQFTKDVFFKDIDFRTFQMIPGEVVDMVEPDFFIPKLPMALLLGSKTIGIGTNSVIVPYRLDSICDAVKEYCDFVSKHGMHIPWDGKSVASMFVPYFPINVCMRNIPQVLRDQQNGIYDTPIINDGTIRINSNEVIVKTLPINKTIPSCYEGIISHLRSQKGSWLDKNLISFNDYSESKMEADLTFKFKRSVDILEAAMHIKKLVKYTGSVVPSFNFALQKHIVQLTPPQILRSWYSERYNSILGGKKYKQMKLAKDIAKTEIGLIISDHVKEVIEVIRKNDIDKGQVLLGGRFELTPTQVQMLYNMPLKTLSRTSKDELRALMKTLKEKNKELLDSYGKIHGEIYDDIEKLKNKYGKILSRSKSYVSYIRVDDKYVMQFNTLSEMKRMLGELSRYDITIHHIPNSHKISLYENYPHASQYGLRNDTLLPELFESADMVYNPRSIKHSFIKKDGKISYICGVVHRSNEYEVEHIRKNELMGITTSGSIKQVRLEQFTERRTTASGVKSNYIHVCDQQFNRSGMYYIVSMNTSVPNRIRIYQCGKNTKKVNSVVSGDTHIIGVYTDKETMFTMPGDCVKNLKIKHIILNNIGFASDKSYIDINLNVTRFKHKEVVKDRDAELATIDVYAASK